MKNETVLFNFYDTLYYKTKTIEMIIKVIIKITKMMMVMMMKIIIILIIINRLFQPGNFSAGSTTGNILLLNIKQPVFECI